MFLKSLEVRGFKSFADKTELRFDKGITAVVGPNGSGKSNVSDAVRWVLGEQSAKTLRGSKMEDIIFTGTQYRKAIGIANVSLTLDNSDESLPIDFNEVKVTRRIYRSGESEYLINNTACRLKDVVNLFMDTGIGKEGYSLIGQGKIDAILSGKSEDRRALLEEAAGIVKYKSRKNEAERRLKNTAENLTRINDIVFTYEERLEPLEQEKKKAEKYIYLSSELRDMDINLLVNNLAIINVKIKEKEEIIKKIEEETKFEREKNSNARENLKKLRLDLEKLERDNQSKNELYISTKDAVSNAKYEISLLEERIKNYNLSIKKSEEDININIKKQESIKKEFEVLKISLEEHLQKLDKLANSLDENEKKRTELQKVLLAKECEREVLKNKDIESMREESNYFSKKSVLESKIDGFNETLKANRIKIDGLDSTLKITTLTKTNLDNEFFNENEKKNSLDLERKSKVLQLSTKRESLNKKEMDISKCSSSLSRLDANKDMLEKLEKSYEGYNISVKRLMSNIEKGMLDIKKSDSVILGEIINTKKGFEVAIETSLAGAISNIVTTDEFVAKKMIEHLKKNKLGRATFLPLSVIKGKKIVLDKDLERFDGYLGIASDIVEYDNKYENIVTYALGRIIVCRDIDVAIAFAKKILYKYKIVTLTGEVVNVGGALTGGSNYQKNMGIISRKTQIESLDNQIRGLKENLEKIINDKNKILIDIKKREEMLSFHDDKIKKTELECVNLSNEIKKISSDSFNLKTSLKNLNLEVINIDSKKESILVELEKIEIKYETMKSKGNNNKSLIEKLSMEINIIISDKDLIDKNNTSLKIDIASIKATIDSKNRDIIREERELLEIDENNKQIQKREDVSRREIKDIEKKILDNKSFINYEEEKLLNLAEKSKSFESFRIKIKEKINKLESEVELLTLIIAKRDEEIHKHKIIFTKYESEKENSQDKLSEEYKIDVDDVSEKFDLIEDIDKHKANIYSLKSRINALGRVNVNAIEEFKEISEKYKFIVSERSDLESAREELLVIIEDMTTKMKVIFRQNFNILNQNFDSTFKELFKGGSAKLILDDEDELSGDIEIRVQPPGKKIQNINLMSGGEKVLSAIALLFAILRMKPTPFCILDEIEAALDDANVSRYADFLKQFSDNIQFIVITHRKGTMEVADVMYGVTMEEKGISKIVSVDLNKK